MQRLPLSAALLGPLLCLPVFALADEAAVWLEGPRAFVTGWETRSLAAADLDGDGRADLTLIDNERARLLLLYQATPDRLAEARQRPIGRDRWEPVLDDAPFVKTEVSVGFPAYCVAIGDLDGNGRPDFAYTAGEDALTVRYQDEPGKFTRTWTFEALKPLQQLDTLQVRDLDADGRADLAVLAEGEILVFRQGDDGRLADPDRYLVSETNVFGLLAWQPQAEAATPPPPPPARGGRDRDRARRSAAATAPVAPARPALAFHVGGSKQGLRVRFADGATGYGPEVALPLAVGGTSAERLRQPDGSDLLAYVKNPARTLEVVRVRRTDLPVASPEDLQPLVYSTSASARQPALYALADFDGDALLDLAAVEPRTARVFLFLQRPDGSFAEGRDFPTLSNVTSVAAGDFAGTGRAALVVCAARDNLLGLASFDGQRMSFPALLEGVTDAVLVAAANLGADGRPHLLAARKEKDRGSLAVLAPPAEAGGPWTVAVSAPLADTRRDPEAVLTGNLDGRPGDELMVFLGRDPPQFFSVAESLELVPAALASPLRKTLLGSAEPVRTTLTDLDGDGRAEILLADGGLIRVIALDDDGGLTLRDQYNSRQADDRLAGVVPATVGGETGLLAYDPATRSFLWLPREEDGLYRYRSSHEAGAIELRELLVRPLGPGQPPRLLALGADRFWDLRLDRRGWAVDVVSSYESDLRDLRYSAVFAGDFNADSRPDALAFGFNTNVLEVLAGAGEGTWRPALHFLVYDENPNAEGRRRGGMRECVPADLNGDGLQDFAILVHDRVLTYFQRPVTPGGRP